MRIFALSDLHLSFANPERTMNEFGESWYDHPRKIAANWNSVVCDDDLVIIAGDISWATRIEDVKIDLEWISELPGTKVMIKGNHDYWWNSINKIRGILPANIHAIQYDSFILNGVAIGGTRLWDCPGIDFSDFIDWIDGLERPPDPFKVDYDLNMKIYKRELKRLSNSMNSMKSSCEIDNCKIRIVALHFPPCDYFIRENDVTSIIDNNCVDHVIFGHLHNIRSDIGKQPFGLFNGVQYHLTACDFIDFTPKLITEI